MINDFVPKIPVLDIENISKVQILVVLDTLLEF